MAMFLLVGCQTTQSAEVKSEPEPPKVVKEIEKLPEEKKVEVPKMDESPFKGKDIPFNIVVKSVKPVLCGRTDTILNSMFRQFGEKPIVVGEVETVSTIGGPKKVMATLTFNPETGSFTFLEQMPAEDRLMCMLSQGKATLNKELLKESQKSQGSAL